jgi:hypothetical protein
LNPLPLQYVPSEQHEYESKQTQKLELGSTLSIDRTNESKFHIISHCREGGVLSFFPPEIVQIFDTFAASSSRSRGSLITKKEHEV